MKVLTIILFCVILLKTCECLGIFDWNPYEYFHTWLIRNKTDVQQHYENNTCYEILPREKHVSQNSTRRSCATSSPNAHLTTPQLIMKYGYPAESHSVRTADGYLLELHRIPRPRGSPCTFVSNKTVFLQHGFLGSSADWVLTGPGKGLAYILADAGYDVWMGNVRGNTYSRTHDTISPDSIKFWNFTWHEIGTLDLPAAIDFITALKNNNCRIHYVGHSMGTTVLFVLLSTRPEYNNILRAGYALAPIAYMSDVKFPGKMLAPAAEAIERVTTTLLGSELLPNKFPTRWTLPHTCDLEEFDFSACTQTVNILCSHGGRRFSKHLLPVIFGHTPAGTSLKNLVHYAQQLVAKVRFQQFDYGPQNNYKFYGTETPPEYPVYNISLPLALLNSKHDELGGVADVQKLRQKLNNVIEHYLIPHKRFSHMDFLYAHDANYFVYRKLLELISRMDDLNI